MSPLFSAVAISQSVGNSGQSVASNNQVQLGDVFAAQTLNVETVSDSVSGTTTSTGNSVYGAVASGGLDVESTQSVIGNITATTHFDATADVGGQTSLLTASTANTAEVDSVQGGGAITGNLSQFTDAFAVTAETDFSAPTASLGAVSSSTQAIANSVGVIVVDTTANLTIGQQSLASVYSDVSSQATGAANIGYSAGTVTFSSSAVANNITGEGESVAAGTSQGITATQRQDGPLTQADAFIGVDNTQTVTGQATATANNLSVSNIYGPAAVSDTQTNNGFTFADAEVSAFEFGSGQASAFGVGNSVMVANQGPSTTLDNNQTDNVDTQANASFTGTGGAVAYDATSSATAMGNAATAFACSDCGGVINVNNSQVNSGNVSATSSLEIDGSNRSVNGVATAVGNSATFYVSKPSN